MSTSPSILFTSVTPLYGFTTDSKLLSINDKTIITRIADNQPETFSPDDVFMQFIRLHEPQHLLWMEVNLSSEDITKIGSLLAAYRSGAGEKPLRSDTLTDAALPGLILPVSQLLQALHLFNPGRLVAGDTSFFVNTGEPCVKTAVLARCSEMVVDFQFVQQFSPHYQLNKADVPFFVAFWERLEKFRPVVQRYPQIELALYRYANESAQYGDAINLIVALEALLVPETEGITYKLSQRVANVLGQDASSRKELFRSVSDFYGLRSRIVHGARLKTKEMKASLELDKLRELTRRTILSVMALADDLGLEPELYKVLDEMCLDDDLRRSMQKRASALMNIGM